MRGPDGSGSMGGQDPEKYGPIRTLVAYYGKMAHPFRACVRDNTKRFGPHRVNQVCAWIKDQARGTTHWRNTEGIKPFQHGGPHPLREADFREMMRSEGFTEDQIEIAIFNEAGAPDTPSYKDLRAYAMMACDHHGLNYDENAVEHACPNCGSWVGCDCKLDGKMQEAAEAMRMKHLLEARPSGEADIAKADRTPGLADDLAAQRKLIKQTKGMTTGSGSKSSTKHHTKQQTPNPSGPDTRAPREVARAENGQIVYDDGSVKDTKTGITKYPAHVFQDGSVRYDDGSTAKPGSLAALMVMMPMRKEDRAKLAVAGPKGLPISEFQSVQDLIKSVIGQIYSGTGVGGRGELTADQAAQHQGVASNEGPGGAPEIHSPTEGFTARDYAGVVGQGTAADLQRRNAAADARQRRKADGTNIDKYAPVRVQRGEKITRGPDGGRGVWRTIGGHALFIKIGQSPAQAAADAKARQGTKPRK